jgi:hypothetical protein
LVELLPRHFDPNIHVNRAYWLNLQDAIAQRKREILAGMGEAVARGDVLPEARSLGTPSPDHAGASPVGPFKRVGSIPPLRAGHGVLLGPGIANRCLDLRKLGFRIGVQSELVVHHCQPARAYPVVELALATGARALELPAVGSR